MQRVLFSSPDFVLHALMLQNIDASTFKGTINVAFWSVAVECQLYAMYPIAILARHRWGWKGMLILSVGVSALTLIIAAASFGLAPGKDSIWASPFALWPTWVIGAAIAERHDQGIDFFKSHRRWILVSGVLLFLSSIVGYLSPFSFQFAATGWAAALDAYVFRDYAANVFSRTTAFIGVVSYSLYLIHVPLLGFAVRSVEAIHHVNRLGHIVIGTFIFFPVLTLLAWISYELVERSGIRLGRFLSEYSARPEPT